MFEAIKNEMLRNKMLAVYTEAKETYIRNMKRLYQTCLLSYTLGPKGKPIMDKANEAIIQCKNCIRRFDIMIDSLNKRDYSYLKEKAMYISNITRDFEKICNELNADIHELVPKKEVCMH